MKPCLEPNPGTVLEVGSGCAVDLPHNIKMLNPGMGVYGIDISEGNWIS